VSAAVGLVLADLVLAKLETIFEQRGGAPFWVDGSLSSGTILYVVGLAVLGAAIIGVAPAIKATGRRLQSGLRELGGGAGLQLGRQDLNRPDRRAGRRRSASRRHLPQMPRLRRR
jgi:hypothetical protein